MQPAIVRLSIVASLALGLALALGLGACEAERPPQPTPVVAPAAAQGSSGAVEQATPTYDPAKDAAVLTFAGERGEFRDTNKAENIASEGKAMVRVVFLDGPAPPSGQVWVGDFRQADDSGRVALSTVPREEFEERALGQGLASPVDLQGGMAAADGSSAPDTAAPSGDVIVYKTSWCGVCKKLEGYLKKKGVSYQAKDIEKDPKAAAELRAKAAKANVRTGSVPIVDVRGQLMVGFDRARLERLL